MRIICLQAKTNYYSRENICHIFISLFAYKVPYLMWIISKLMLYMKQQASIRISSTYFENVIYLTPFPTNENFHKATCYEVRMVHCIYWGVTGYNFKNILYCFAEDQFCLGKQCRPWWNAKCGISSGSSLSKYRFRGSGLQRIKIIGDALWLTIYIYEPAHKIVVLITYRHSGSKPRIISGETKTE